MTTLFKIVSTYSKICAFLNTWFTPILLLISRLWMARIFWYSGVVKLSNWNATLYLFAHEYKTPILSPTVAAFFATLFEITCPILLALGIATRLGTAPLLVMTAVIWLNYHEELHFLWGLLLAFILCAGPGFISVDAIISKLWQRRIAS